MLRGVGRLVGALRARGLAVSPAEAADAAEALRAVSIDDREQVRAALAATLAKGRAERQVFELLFDEQFAWRGIGRGPGKGSAARGGEGAGGRGRLAGVSAVRPAGARPPQGGPPRPSPGALRRAQDHPRGAAEPRAVSRRTAEAPRPGERRAPLAAVPRRGPRRILVSRPPHADPRSAAGVGTVPPRSPLIAGPMTTDEERRLAGELPRLIQEIRLRRGRRWLADARGRVWLRGAARHSAATGGVPFELPARRRKPKPARLLVLVDVSWSAARASGLFLALALRLLRTRSRCRILAFVDRPVDVTDLVKPWAEGRCAPVTGPEAADASPRRRARTVRAAPALGIAPPWGGVSFRALLEKTAGLDLDAASDFGRAFWSLARGGGAIRRDSLIVVLGDGRSNRFDPQEWALEEISRRARGVLWLVPEPHARWGTGDSALPEYFPWCDAIVETADLDGLVAGVREILRRL